MNKLKKEPRCPECDSNWLLFQYSNDVNQVQIYCGDCGAESRVANACVGDRLIKAWGIGKDKMDKIKATLKAEEKADRERRKIELLAIKAAK